MNTVTKAELEEYVEELEGTIEDAFEALEADRPRKAKKILAEYIEEQDEPEEKEEGNEEEPEEKNG